MELLLVGGTGVLSGAVTKEALSRGFSVTMINRGNRKNRIPQNAIFIKANHKDYDKIQSCIFGKHYDAVIDFLCESEKDTENSFRFYSSHTNQYFFISSTAVIDTRVGGLLSENSPKPLPFWEYSVNKWESEKKIVELSKELKTVYTIVRPCVTYDDTRIPYGITPKYGYHWTMLERAKKGKPIITWNNGRNCCNMTRVEDFAKGVVGLIGNTRAYNEAINVCGVETPSFSMVLSCLEKFTGITIPTIDIPSSFFAKHLPERSGEILGGRSIDACHSNEKLLKIVPDLQFDYLLNSGLKKTIDAYINNSYQKGIDWGFDGDMDRVISKWCKKNGLKKESYNIGFIDYLGNATDLDKREYLRHYRLESFPYQQLFYLKRIVSFIKRRIVHGVK